MSNRRMAVLAAGVGMLALLVLTGCRSPSEEVDTSMTVEQAKATAMAMEDEIAGLVPPEHVAGREQRSTGPLLSCSETAHQWTGRTKVELQGDPDVDRVLEDVAEQFAGAGFEANFDESLSGQTRLQLVGRQGAGYIAGRGAGDEAQTLVITSFSPCFVLPEGVYPGGTF